MSDTCSSCRRPNASPKNRIQCGLCQGRLCKGCTHFLDASEVSFLKTVPDDLVHGSYCGPCYEKKVVPALESYSEVMERARQLTIFYKNERNVPPHRRPNKMLSVQDCQDRKETLLRLAFFAAEQSFTALVDVELNPKKVRTDGYQKTSWSGTAFPARLLVEKR